MNDERLSRHFRQENADLKSENTRLKMQAETQESRLREKDSEVLRLLNQIATDMIRKDEVDRLIKEAVEDVNAKWQKRFNDFQEESEAKHKKTLEAMAAEYEAKIAELQNQNNKGKDVNPSF